jgi:hypothetical protein
MATVLKTFGKARQSHFFAYSGGPSGRINPGFPLAPALALGGEIATVGPDDV